MILIPSPHHWPPIMCLPNRPTSPTQPPSPNRLPFPQPYLSPKPQMATNLNPYSNQTQHLPPIYHPTLNSDTKLVIRCQHGIFKPNKKYYNPHTHDTKSLLPHNRVSTQKRLELKNDNG